MSLHLEKCLSTPLALSPGVPRHMLNVKRNHNLQKFFPRWGPAGSMNYNWWAISSTRSDPEIIEWPQGRGEGGGGQERGRSHVAIKRGRHPPVHSNLVAPVIQSCLFSFFFLGLVKRLCALPFIPQDMLELAIEISLERERRLCHLAFTVIYIFGYKCTNYIYIYICIYTFVP